MSHMHGLSLPKTACIGANSYLLPTSPYHVLAGANGNGGYETPAGGSGAFVVPAHSGETNGTGRHGTRASALRKEKRGIVHTAATPATATMAYNLMK